MRPNIIHFAGIFWMCAGIIAGYFAFLKIKGDSNLRERGVWVKANYVSSSIQYGLKSTSQKSGRVLNEQDYQHFQSQPDLRNRLDATYIVTYSFQTPSGETIESVDKSSFSHVIDKSSPVEVIYLPENPRVNALKKNVSLASGYLLFWIVGGLVWLLFFAVPGFGLFYLASPKRQIENRSNGLN